MAVISISITQSAEQIIAGIPKSIIIAANIPCNIFYTLDNSDPSDLSNLKAKLYVSPIFFNSLPTISPSLTVKIFATNGVDSSPVIVETYLTNILNDTRLPHSPTDAAATPCTPNLYPYGTSQPQPVGVYLNPAEAGVTVYNPDLPGFPTAFTADGYPTAFTNYPYTSENYNIQYSTTDAIGQTGHGIGTLPDTVTIKPEVPPAEETQQFSNMFDPRAMVIFQDFSKENPNDPPQINRQFFSMENSDRIRDGNNYFNSGLDAPPVTGGFLRSHYNPRTNEITYYYYDSPSNRWIISTTPYQPTGTFDGNMASAFTGRGAGSNHVYEWIPFKGRTLF